MTHKFVHLDTTETIEELETRIRLLEAALERAKIELNKKRIIK